MVKRIVGLLLLVIGLCVAVLLVYFATGKTLEMTVSKSEMEQRVADAFPIARSVVKLDILNPKIDTLVTDKRITLSGNVKIAVLGMINVDGTCRISGQPIYNTTDNAIQLEKVEVEELTLTGAPEKLHDQVVELASKAIRTFLTDYPLYKFSNDKWLWRFIGDHVRGVKVEQDGLVLILGW